MAKVNLILCDSSIKDRNGNDKIVAWICDCTQDHVRKILSANPTWYSKEMN
jgi:hypothetical protein